MHWGSVYFILLNKEHAEHIRTSLKNARLDSMNIVQSLRTHKSYANLLESVGALQDKEGDESSKSVTVDKTFESSFDEMSGVEMISPSKLKHQVVIL